MASASSSNRLYGLGSVGEIERWQFLAWSQGCLLKLWLLLGDGLPEWGHALLIFGPSIVREETLVELEGGSLLDGLARWH